MGPLRSCDDSLPGCRGRKGERTGYVLKLTSLWRMGGIQDIADKDIEAEKTECDKKDDQRGKQQERPGRGYDSDGSGDED